MDNHVEITTQVVDKAPWWAQYVSVTSVALITSGAVIIEALRRWMTGHGKAEVRNLNIQAKKAETELALNETQRHVDYERMLNDRTFKTMDMLQGQVDHLSKLVEAQSKMLSDQSMKMDHMEAEIIALRRALDERTNQLNDMKLQFPLACRNCPTFNSLELAVKAGIKNLGFEDQQDLPFETAVKSTKV